MPSGTRLFLGRIHPDVQERDIEKLFKGYGRINDLSLKQGFAFVVSLCFSPSFFKETSF